MGRGPEPGDEGGRALMAGYGGLRVRGEGQQQGCDVGLRDRHTDSVAPVSHGGEGGEEDGGPMLKEGMEKG